MQIGTCFGIPLKVNPFFLFFLGAALLWGRLWEALLLIAIVLWHESFHILAARLYGLTVLEIELLPCGGVARLDAFLQLNPQLEWIVAIVGPLGNLLLVLVAHNIASVSNISLEWLQFIFRANLAMALFNLLPILPLDGGRVLRSILATRLGFQKATRLTARWSQTLSLGLVGFGIWVYYRGQPWGLMFILLGLMLFCSARKEQAEATYILLRYLTRKQREIRQKKVMTARELIACSEAPLSEILQFWQPPHYHIIWVVDHRGALVGFLGELELIRAYFEQGPSCLVGTLIKMR